MSGCGVLVNFPQLDVDVLQDATQMFRNCVSLNDTSLNNILAMCANTTSAYTGTKTIWKLGLSSYISKISTLSNWEAANANGWEIQ